MLCDDCFLFFILARYVCIRFYSKLLKISDAVLFATVAKGLLFTVSINTHLTYSWPGARNCRKPVHLSCKTIHLVYYFCFWAIVNLLETVDPVLCACNALLAPATLQHTWPPFVLFDSLCIFDLQQFFCFKSRRWLHFFFLFLKCLDTRPLTVWAHNFCMTAWLSLFLQTGQDVLVTLFRHQSPSLFNYNFTFKLVSYFWDSFFLFPYFCWNKSEFQTRFCFFANVTNKSVFRKLL